MRVRFQSDDANNYKGFQMRYTAIPGLYVLIYAKINVMLVIDSNVRSGQIND